MIEKCSQANREVGDPQCASDLEIEEFYDGMTVLYVPFQDKLDLFKT